MQKQLIFILALITGHPVCYGQTYSDLIPDSEIVSFMTWEIRSTERYSEEPILSLKRKIYYEISDWDTLNFVKPESQGLGEKAILASYLYLFHDRNQSDTIFSQEDKEYLLQQFISIKDTLWQQKFPKATRSKRKNQVRPNRYHYSLPLFSKDKQYVIVKRDYYCGSLCAYGGYFIYRRLDKNTWEFVTIINPWIS